MKKLFVLLFVGSHMLVYASSEGKEFFDEAKCMECHTSKDFTKGHSKAKNYKHVVTMVDACQINNNVGWFDEDIKEVSDYLNGEYYHFK